MRVEWMEQDGSRLWHTSPHLSAGGGAFDEYESYLHITLTGVELHSLPYGKVVAVLAESRERFEQLLQAELRKARL